MGAPTKPRCMVNAEAPNRCPPAGASSAARSRLGLVHGLTLCAAFVPVMLHATVRLWHVFTPHISQVVEMYQS